MSSGPITIYDKSALQALSVDQAALFGQFYRIVITPLFFVETLADLEKEVDEGKTPEAVVGLIAAKTANQTADANAHHSRLIVAELLGHRITMDGRPHVVGGRHVMTKEGRRGIVYDDAPEAKALDRWQKQRFLEIEREIAKHWRESLQELKIRKLDVNAMFAEVPRPRSLEDVRDYAAGFARQADGPSFLAALNTLQVPAGPRGTIFQRWLEHGSPSLGAFAPYAAHVLTVQVFFELAVSLGLISGDRPSNAADMAYLFYLPFCMIFTSADKLHMKTAPLFLRRDQVFLSGADLKADLKRLDEYFSAQPKEVLDRGVMFFEPPYNGDFITSKLWKQCLPGWRSREGQAKKKPMDPEREKKLLEQFKAETESPEVAPIDSDSADFVVIQRAYPVRMGNGKLSPRISPSARGSTSARSARTKQGHKLRTEKKMAAR